MASFVGVRTARAKVIKGRRVTRTKLPDGTKPFDKPQLEIELDDEDEKAFDHATVAVRRGETIPLETLRAILHWF